MVNAKVFALAAAALFNGVMAVTLPENNYFDNLQQLAMDPSQLGELRNQLQMLDSELDGMSEQLKNVDELAFPSVEGFLSGVVWPLGFAGICEGLYRVEITLEGVVKKYTTGPSNMGCTTRQNQAINSGRGCNMANGITDLASTIVWPLAIESIKHSVERIDAMASCLASRSLGVSDN